MMSHSKFFGLALASMCIFSCGNTAGETTDATSSTTAGPSTSETSVEGTTTTQGESSGSTESTSEPTTEEPTTGETTTGEPTTTSELTETTCGFICEPWSDMGTPECSTYEEDCPNGQKCMPYGFNESYWNSLKCVDVSGSNTHGDPCTVQGSGVSGNDDCALHAMCWDVDPETNEGTCVQFCDGNSEMPTCEPEGTSCVIANEGVLNLCLPTCNPLIQDCPEGKACYPLNNDYQCFHVAVPPDKGLEGGPCEFTHACQAGLMCVGSDSYPNGCGADGCCASFCDLSAPDCQVPDTQCVAINENPKPGQENYGVCRLPD